MKLFIKKLFQFLVILILYNANSECSNTKKVLFIVHTETINGKGVFELYQKMKKKKMDVKIAFIPLISVDKVLYDLDTEFSKKFNSTDVTYPCGKAPPYEKCAKLDENFDYIFVQNPYDTASNNNITKPYSFEMLRKQATKIAYIVYGPHLFHQTTCNDLSLKNKIDLVFVDSESTKKVFKEQLDFEESKVIVSGYQSYKNVRNKIEKFKKIGPETILWMPRWTIHFRNRNQHESGSTFLNYWMFFLNYAQKNSHINFIIRPHVLLFKYAVESHFLSDQQLKYIIDSFKALTNVRFSEHINSPLENDIVQSDIVIADGTSALAEAVVGRKPIIYLSNGMNHEFTSNDLGGELQNFLYMAYDPNDIINHIQDIRKNNYLPCIYKEPNKKIDKIIQKFKPFAKNQDYEAFRKKLDPVDDPAQFITDYVFNNK